MKIVITAPFAAQQVEQLRKDHEVWFQPQTEDVPLRTQLIEVHGGPPGIDSIDHQPATSAQGGHAGLRRHRGAGALDIHLQFARLRNPCRLIALGTTTENTALAREFGADETVNIREEDAAARIRELTGGAGCDVYIECSGQGICTSAVQRSPRERP